MIIDFNIFPLKYPRATMGTFTCAIFNSLSFLLITARSQIKKKYLAGLFRPAGAFDNFHLIFKKCYVSFACHELPTPPRVPSALSIPFVSCL